MVKKLKIQVIDKIFKPSHYQSNRQWIKIWKINCFFPIKDFQLWVILLKEVMKDQVHMIMENSAVVMDIEISLIKLTKFLMKKNNRVLIRFSHHSWNLRHFLMKDSRRKISKVLILMIWEEHKPLKRWSISHNKVSIWVILPETQVNQELQELYLQLKRHLEILMPSISS